MKRLLQLPRPEILIVAGVALLAFAITLGILVSAAGASARRAAAEQRLELERARKPPLFSPEEPSITAEDFLLPETPSVEKALRYVPFRPRFAKWSSAMVRKYWIPPRDIALEILSAINDQNMKRLFEKVP